MVVKLYIDPLSQPARALMLFVRATKIPFEEVIISIQKGEQKTPDYEKVNRFRKIPAIVHEDFHLAESVAIFKYLSKTFSVADHWYPKDVKQQARVDEFMAWQHLGLRSPLTRALLAKLKPEALSATPPSESQHAEHQTKRDEALDLMENLWLEGDAKFVAGDEISIADLLAVGEIEMLRLVGYNPREGRPKLTAYLDRVQDQLSSFYDEVHAPLKAAAEYFKALLASK